MVSARDLRRSAADADGGLRRAQRLKRSGRIAGGVVLTLLGLLLVTFVIGRVLPTDPILAALGDRLSGAAYAHARSALGFDKPLYQQFFIYVFRALHGEFGNSVLTSNPVIEDIAHFFPATVELATAATVIGVGLGVPLGVYAAARRDGWADRGIRLVGLLGYSIPIFWLGLVGLLVFYVKLDLVAGPGRIDIGNEDIVTPITGLLLVDSLVEGQWWIFFDAVRHLILPASLLGWYSFAYVSRMTRSLMIEQFGQEYIVTARIKGLTEAAIVRRHAFANILPPLVTVVALSYAGLLEGSVLTETVFAWPGIGAYITNSLLNADMNAVLGATIVVGIVFIVLNLAAELIQPRLDPRAR
ncbi:MAG: peptide transporter permease [Rhodospirillales bacterium]|jgi:peptide/nickel transport system permease protein|nr:peptide transporter permease [Rhodospirillales bacterium]